MDGTIIGQGSFKQGELARSQIIAIPSGTDWLEIYNWTQTGLGLGNGFKFYWQRPNGPLAMGDGTQGIYEASGAAATGGSYGPVASFYGETAGTGNTGGTDYAGTVAVKTIAGSGRLPFPRAGVSVPLVNGITSIDGSSFNLADVGTYEVSWSVQTTELGQWQIELNGLALDNTVLVDQNPTSGGHPVSGMFLITTTVADSVLAIINPTGNSTALTITPADGAETHANTPTLTIAMIGSAAVVGSSHPVLVGQTASQAFKLYDPSGQTQGSGPLLSAPVATTASTNATQPVVSTASTAGLSAGSVVRLSGTAQSNVNGIDFVVSSVVSNTSFTLMNASNAFPNVPGAIGGAGFYRIVNYANAGLFYPRSRTITNITQAINAQVSTSLAHGLTCGQEVRFNIPVVSGMIQLNANPLNNYYPTNSAASAVVVSIVDDYNFTISIDTTGYTAFTFPVITQQPSNFPQVVPFGEDTATALTTIGLVVPMVNGQQIYNTNTGILADSTVNTGFLGMTLAAGSLLPAGSSGDVIFWKAGKSTYGGL